MDKKSFLDMFEREELDCATKIFDGINAVYQYGSIMIIDDFLPPNIWTKTCEYITKFGLEHEVDGFFDYSERKMLCVYERDSKFDFDFPYVVLRINNKSKFKNLEHKHFLGTLMSLGIKREKLGDLIVKDRSCFFPIATDVVSFIRMSLEKINGCPVDIEEIDKDIVREALKESKRLEKVVLSSSLRIDCLVSSITNLSRGKSDKLIESKKVKIDYREITKRKYEVKMGSVLTIRGFGKFIIKEIVGETKKERYKVKIEQF